MMLVWLEILCCCDADARNKTEKKGELSSKSVLFLSGMDGRSERTCCKCRCPSSSFFLFFFDGSVVSAVTEINHCGVSLSQQDR